MITPSSGTAELLRSGLLKIYILQFACTAESCGLRTLFCLDRQL